MVWGSLGSVLVAATWFIVRINIELVPPQPLFGSDPVGIGDYVAAVLGILGIAGIIASIFRDK